MAFSGKYDTKREPLQALYAVIDHLIDTLVEVRVRDAVYFSFIRKGIRGSVRIRVSISRRSYERAGNFGNRYEWNASKECFQSSWNNRGVCEFSDEFGSLRGVTMDHPPANHGQTVTTRIP